MSAETDRDESVDSEVLKQPEARLCGEQKKVYRLDPTGTVLVRGSAGSGKTFVAMARARFLDAYAHGGLFDDCKAKTGFFVYNTSLRDYVSRHLRETGVRVATIISWATRFLRERDCVIGRLPGAKTNGEFMACLVQAREDVFGKDAKSALAKKPSHFYKEELEWIKKRQIDDEDSYLRTPRIGRGANDRVSSEDRHSLWLLKEAYDKRLQEKGLMTYEAVVNLAVKKLRESPLPDNELFSYTIIDEAQDFTLAQLRLVSLITAGAAGKKNMTIFADMAQKIYSTGFSWKEANLHVASHRSFVFRKNYRNTRQIAAAACSLISHESEETAAEMTKMDIPDREGKKPLLVIGDYDAVDVVFDFVMKEIDTLSREDSIAFTAYDAQEQDYLVARLQARGVAVRRKGQIFQKSAGQGRVVDVYSMHSLKGLQFDHVILWGLSAGRFPPWALAADTARRLLYVAMTRARKTLTLCCLVMPSSLVGEMGGYPKLDVKVLRRNGGVQTLNGGVSHV